MSKQDRQGVRTATDLERKYGFGQSFAEVFDLANDAKNTAEEAKNAANNVSENMTTEQIFNMLTRFGLEQGVFRAEDCKLYINAEYLYGKILAGQDLEVDAATIKGKLDASKADISELEVDAAKVKGTMEAVTINSSTVYGGTFYDSGGRGALWLAMNSQYGNAPWLIFADAASGKNLFEVVPLNVSSSMVALKVGDKILCTKDGDGIIHLGNDVVTDGIKTIAVFG